MGGVRLLECPFCGSSGVFVFHQDVSGAAYVTCPACDCSGPHVYRSSSDAVEAWNRRASDRYTLTEAGKAALKDGG